MNLNELSAGQTAIIKTVNGQGALRQHFLDMGVIPNEIVKVVKFAPMGDPMAINIHGYELTLRLADAACIEVELLVDEEFSFKENKRINKKITHPSLGEPGVFHDKTNEHPYDDNHVLTFALMGNQNCGKTTLFNVLTGANQHVGNFPGVTVDRKDGSILKHPNTLITDLPGIYSLSPYTTEEIVSRNFILENQIDAIINIVDATNMERNLYLTLQLLELNIPMVIALNMMDELVGNGGSVDVNKMEALLGVPVVPISAAKKSGIEELVTHALHVAKYQEKPLYYDFCGKDDYGGAVHRCIHATSHLIEDHAKDANLPLRFAATKAIEGDELLLKQLELEQNELDMLEHIALQMEKERQLDRSAAIADMRFDYIQNLCLESLNKPHESKEKIRSAKIDKILTGKYTAIPVFILIMALIFYLSFDAIGGYLQNSFDLIIESIINIIDKWLTLNEVNITIHRFIVEGLLQGIGSVLSFLPVVVMMFFFLSLLEDSGYLARIAFVMDKLLRKIGLSGRSIVPMLIGFGCSVPAIMSTRTLPSKRDRTMTIMLTPFMSCTAKLPIYGFFVDAFFPDHKGLIMIGLYVLGVSTGILVAHIFKKTIFKGEAMPFVMEIPNYRLPSLKSTLLLMWEKAKDFIEKAFSIILIASALIWLLQSFDFNLNMVDDSANSMLATIAGLLVPLFKPLGLGDWRICTALISGFMAKESVVTTLEVLFASAGGITSCINIITAASLLIYSLLYTPCIAAIVAVKKELGGKWAIGVVLWQCILAWVVTYIFVLIVKLI